MDPAATATNQGVVNEKPIAPLAGALHTIGLILIIAGGAALTYFAAGSMRGTEQPNRILFYLTTMGWEWLLFAYVVFGLRRRGVPLQEVLGPRWRGIAEIRRDIGIAFVFWIAALVVLAMVAHLLHVESMQRNVRFISPEGPVEILLWILTSVTAGICEETIFRGYLQKQFIAWTGNVVVGVVLSALLFGAAHSYQGEKAVVLIAVYGLLFGILAQMRKNVRPGMITHAMQDTISGIAIRFLPK